jgi:transaldolase
MSDREIGFSLWLDFIERDFLNNDFDSLLKENIITGATSNPAIFASAINKSKAYKEQLESLKGKSPKEKYEALAIEDIKKCAKRLRGCYDKCNDGYISIEVDPSLSNDTQKSLSEARRLFKAIDEPNVMIKIPATKAGYEAMNILMAEGIPVNATLVFSPEQAKECMDAMTQGIAKGEVDGSCRVEGVISVFVSRFDRLLDNELKEKGISPSKTGIYNASKIYNMIEENGISNIRTLFASTSVKGDDLPKDYYITNLVAPHSINTAPLETINAYVKTQNKEIALPISDNEIDEYFLTLKDNNIDIDSVYNKLLEDGLKAFEEAFNEMLNNLKD